MRPTLSKPTVALALALSLGIGCTTAGDEGDSPLGQVTSAVAVAWTQTVNVTPNGASITKTSGTNGSWNAGAISAQSLSGDGFVQFTSAENTSNKFAGLSNGSASTAYTEIDFAFYLQSNGQARIYENGVLRASIGAYTAGDAFRIESAGGQVRYYLRGALVYTSTIAPTLPLLLDTSLASTGATIQNAQIGTDGSAPSWTNVVGVATTLDSLTKTGAAGWNAGASTVDSLSGDGYVQFSTAESTTNKFVGLNNGDASTSYKEIDYAFYMLANGGLRVYENGALRKIVGTYAAGDTFRIELVGAEVRYVVGDVIVYRSEVAPQLPLVLDTALHDTGATVTEVVVGSAVSAPVWDDPRGVSLTANSLTKTSGDGWNAGAATVQSLTGDGHVTFTTGEATTYKFAGLGNGNPGTSYGEIDYAFYLQANGQVRVYESGTPRVIVGSYAAGDTFDIGVVAGVVEYRHNGALVYTSAVAPIFPLVLDTALYTTGTTIQNIAFTP